MLRALSNQPYRRNLIAYAHGNDAALVEVQSVIMASAAGKPTSAVKLRPSRQNDNAMDINVNGMTGDQLAAERARRILLNERSAIGEGDLLLGLFHLDRGGVGKKTLNAVLPKLWSTYKAKPAQYLRLARLQAIFSLKVTNTVEHIFELTLGPISKDGVQVRLEGSRKKIYSNRPAAVIKVEGKCPLPKS
ncbi:hypothetical protein [Candidatus Entotheonella palauensis]|uniref:hypothetical protein n=1 Tax=Candidatus Entotheonella palauensis TaxID=93172 RepID=UPI000B7F4691|nr:hypothetical protein [Candidatus Entotheonella palauensis]